MSMNSSNLTSGFIDLATFDELEKYLFGGATATTYFVRQTRKSTWFTQVPVVLSRSSGTPGFGQEWSVSVSRAGDYLLQTWLRLTVKEIKLNLTNHSDLKSVRWCRNFMHNLVEECNISFNDLVAHRIDTYHLDFWTAFTVPSSKRVGYDNMIGNTDDFSKISSPKTEIAEKVLNLPIPLFYSRDTGVALPTAALPYNEIRISFKFRRWQDLLVITKEINNAVSGKLETVVETDVNGKLDTVPSLDEVQVWSNYSIVSNDERKRMACAPRDMLIEQVQTAPRQSFNPANPQNFDLRFSHAVKALFFAVRNTTVDGERSNYTTQQPNPTTGKLEGSDPIIRTSIIYENTNRLSNMGSDFYSLVQPYYHATSIPEDTGYHMYSYALDMCGVDPTGSTNYGKLTNVTIRAEPSKDAKYATEGKKPDDTDLPYTQGKQKFEMVVTTINNNIIRVSGGALGFPVL